MAAVEIYDYVSTVTADYDYTLSVTPHAVLTDDGDKDQVIHRAVDSVNHERIGFSDDSRFRILLRWDMLSADDCGTIIEMFLDSSKANFYDNSFKFLHPDGHTYVVKLGSRVPRVISPTHHQIDQVILLVIGRIAD